MITRVLFRETWVLPALVLSNEVEYSLEIGRRIATRGVCMELPIPWRYHGTIMLTLRKQNLTFERTGFCEIIRVTGGLS